MSDDSEAMERAYVAYAAEAYARRVLGGQQQMRNRFPDYDEMEALVVAAAKSDPGLQNMILAHPNPTEFVYAMGKSMQGRRRLQSDASSNVTISVGGGGAGCPATANVPIGYNGTDGRGGGGGGTVFVYPLQPLPAKEPRIANLRREVEALPGAPTPAVPPPLYNRQIDLDVEPSK